MLAWDLSQAGSKRDRDLQGGPEKPSNTARYLFPCVMELSLGFHNMTACDLHESIVLMKAEAIHEQAIG